MCVGAGYQNLRTSPAGLWSGIARTPSDRRGRVRNWCRARSRYITHRDGSKPRSIDEVLQKVEEQTGKEGRAAFEKFLVKAMRSSRCVWWRGIKTCEHHPPACGPGRAYAKRPPRACPKLVSSAIALRYPPGWIQA